MIKGKDKTDHWKTVSWMPPLLNKQLSPLKHKPMLLIKLASTLMGRNDRIPLISLCVCAYMCVCVYVCVWMYMYTCVHVYMCECAHLICVHSVCVHVCTCTCVYVYVCVHVCCVHAHIMLMCMHFLSYIINS